MITNTVKPSTHKSRKRLVLTLCLIVTIWIIGGTHEIVRHIKTSQPDNLVKVGFTARRHEPNDQEVCEMVDKIILQVLGPEGLASIIQPGDKVVIKVNNVSPHRGVTGEKGRGIITDPRIVRYIAEKVRSIIGYSGQADLKVVDAVYSSSPDPSDPLNPQSFYWARLERTGDDNVNPGDFCYDFDADGILDGGSMAQLVNLDSYDKSGRFFKTINEPSLGAYDVYMPKFLRTHQEAVAAGQPNEYCDVLIGLPIFKNHSLVGITGAIKLHYGFRSYYTFPGETGRSSHSGTYWDSYGIYDTHLLDEYLCAQNRVRTYDFILMDCLTGNRRGPTNNSDSNVHARVDYILTNAMLGSIDPIAIDTVATLLAGYDQNTVEFLRRGRLDGLGTDSPGFIRVMGLTAFTNHRRFLYNTYNPSGLYPFQDNWGQARVMRDFNQPTNVTVSNPTPLGGNIFAFTYTAEENNPNDLGLARIELLVNGELVAYKNSDISSPGRIEVDLRAYNSGSFSYRLVAWDKAFNCKLSEKKIY